MTSVSLTTSEVTPNITRCWFS